MVPGAGRDVSVPGMRTPPGRRRSCRLRAAALVLASLWASGAAGAQVGRVWVSPDVSVDLDGGPGSEVHDEHVAIDDLNGTFLGPESLGALDPSADLSAFHRRDDGDRLFSLDTTQLLPNGLVAEPRDVVRYDGAVYALELDGSAAGIPNGARIDAVTERGGRLAVSFDTSVDLGGLVVDDEDLVEIGGGLLFDGSAEGVSADLDLDGAHAFADGRLVLSFDGSGNVFGIAFDDEDLIEFDTASASINLVYDGSTQHAGWQGGDLDAVRAVPEPGALPGLLAGVALLWRLAHRRSRTPLAPEGRAVPARDARTWRTPR